MYLIILKSLQLSSIPPIFQQNTVKIFDCYINNCHCQGLSIHVTDNERWSNKMNHQPQQPHYSLRSLCSSSQAGFTPRLISSTKSSTRSSQPSFTLRGPVFLVFSDSLLHIANQNTETAVRYNTADKFKHSILLLLELIM